MSNDVSKLPSILNIARTHRSALSDTTIYIYIYIYTLNPVESNHWVGPTGHKKHFLDQGVRDVSHSSCEWETNAHLRLVTNGCVTII